MSPAKLELKKITSGITKILSENAIYKSKLLNYIVQTLQLFVKSYATDIYQQQSLSTNLDFTSFTK